MRLNLYVACCSALAYFGAAIELPDKSNDELAELYKSEYLDNLA